MDPILVKPEEAAMLLKISRSRVYELIADGSLPSLVIGRSRRIPVDQLRDWIADRIQENDEAVNGNAPDHHHL